MNLVKIVNGSETYVFQINQIKYLICKNNDYYPIYTAMKQFVSKEKSEYRDENNIKVKILIDDQELRLKNNLFIELSDTYSLAEDKKLNTKSLMLKYLEAKLQQSDFIDTINTIDILFHTLSEDVNESSALKIMFQSIGHKQLLKMINPYFGDDFQRDEFDLSLIELLDFQIYLIDYISIHNNIYDNIIVYGRWNHLSNDMIERLNALVHCKVIIFTDCYSCNMKSDDICLIEKDFIDLAYREEFYHFFQ